jgi:hypothetical protein
VLRTEVGNRLIMLGGVVAAELPRPRAGWRRWVAVYPSPSGIVERGQAARTFHIKLFDLPSTKHDTCFFDGDMANLEWGRAGSIEELEAELTNRGIDPALLDAPWKVGYPG